MTVVSVVKDDRRQSNLVHSRLILRLDHDVGRCEIDGAAPVGDYSNSNTQSGLEDACCNKWNGQFYQVNFDLVSDILHNANYNVKVA